MTPSVAANVEENTWPNNKPDKVHQEAEKYLGDNLNSFTKSLIKIILWWKKLKYLFFSFPFLSTNQGIFSINARRANFSMIYCQLALAKLGVNKTRENDGRSNQGEYQGCIRRETQIFRNISTQSVYCIVSLELNAFKSKRYLTICSDKFIEYSFPLRTLFCII